MDSEFYYGVGWNMCTQLFNLFVNELRETKLEIQLDSEKPRTIQRFFFIFFLKHSQVSLVVVNRSNQTENSNQTTVVELLIPQIVWIILAK